MATVHPVAQNGFGTGTNELYDRARPSYPNETLDLIRSKLPGQGPYNIIEIASGTGIFTRKLLDSWPGLIKELHAVEPSQGMREAFLTKTRETTVPVSLSEGTFVATGQESGWADAVFIAQAWHWCHPHYSEGIKEIARILKPGGVAFLVWNMEDRVRSPWVAAVRDLYEKYENDTPQFRRGQWEATFETPSFNEYFQPEERHVTAYSIGTSYKGVEDRVCSKSYITLLPPQDQDLLKKGIKEALDKHEKVWVDEAQGRFEYPYTTTTIVMRKK